MHMARGFCITLNSITSFLCHQSKSFLLLFSNRQNSLPNGPCSQTELSGNHMRVLVCMQSCIAVTRVIFSKYFHQASSPEGGLKKKRLFLCSGSEEGKILNVYGPYATYGVPKLLKILCIANHIYIKFVRRKFCRITFTTQSIRSIQEKACNQNKS